ncbi:uncharacterized protein EMH_0100460 [Eimeria mitis]|uniref:Uncharacterized protein n=1 Tax=Eimeria mitis TaxID=44415 RepID=U6KHI9_9EIME|nr:uncharacterized protein EMH_0100460 [Eimeria mitis]CDJ35742.1 hypothetical protein, conserved [Eimeria mitis]
MNSRLWSHLLILLQTPGMQRLSKALPGLEIPLGGKMAGSGSVPEGKRLPQVFPPARNQDQGPDKASVKSLHGVSPLNCAAHHPGAAMVQCQKTNQLTEGLQHPSGDWRMHHVGSKEKVREVQKRAGSRRGLVEKLHQVHGETLEQTFEVGDLQAEGMTPPSRRLRVGGQERHILGLAYGLSRAQGDADRVPRNWQGTASRG